MIYLRITKKRKPKAEKGGKENTKKRRNLEKTVLEVIEEYPIAKR